MRTSAAGATKSDPLRSRQPVLCYLTLLAPTATATAACGLHHLTVSHTPLIQALLLQELLVLLFATAHL